MSFRILAGLLVGVGLVAACDDDANPAGPAAGTSSGSDGGTPGAPTSVSAANITDFCDGTLGVVIGALEACCTAEDKEAQLYKLTHDLAVILKPSCTLALANSAQSGRVLVQSDRATACYAAYRETYAPGKCENITRTFSDPAGTACREAFIGTVPEGGGCRGDHECLNGLTCAGYTDSADGHCQLPGAIGAACGPAPTDGGSSGVTSLEFGSHPACVDGATCDDLTHKCVAGGAKTKATEGGACEDTDGCAGGLYCEAQKCAPTKPAGQTCKGGLFSSECAGRCDDAGTCKTFCGSR